MSAPSLSSQRVRGLDTLRAAAITAVVVYHMSWDSTNKAFRAIGAFGWTGVDLFFVLSGYLIAGQWFAKAAAGKKIPLGRFYLRRFLRTLPNYFVVFAVSWLVDAPRRLAALARSTLTATAALSTSTTFAAPRDHASSPTAPEPA